MLKQIYKKYKPEIYAIIFLVFSSMIVLSYSNYYYSSKDRDTRNTILQKLIIKKSNIEKALYSRLYYTKGIAAYVSLNPDINNILFQNLAKEIIKEDSVISTMSLSKDCVIGMIYPIEGHEEAIGLDLLSHPKRNAIVQKTIETEQTFVAGPVDLVEGGIAFISYTPIFSKMNDKKYFWGVTDIVIYRDILFGEVGLSTEDSDFHYALKGENGTGEKGSVFWGDETVFDSNPVIIDVTLPTGHWNLAVTPKDGWYSYINHSNELIYLLYLSVLIITVLVWMLFRAYHKLKYSEKELSALFVAMEDVVIKFDKSGKYTSIAPTHNELLYKPKEELLNRKLHEIFDKETADFFKNAIDKCLNTRERVTIDYPLTTNNINRWFRARISYINDNEVLYVAHDNTEFKIAEDKLKKSEEELKELNIAKDKFFSILAHDLRSPIGSFMNVTEMLYSDYKLLDEAEKIELLEIIKNTSKSVYLLLENLLMWSRSQRGILKFEPSENTLNYVTDNVINTLKPVADEKNISLKSNIDDRSIAYFDYNMINTVLRNLVSNAIKFSNSLGIIEILYSDDRDDGKITITVSDNGVGIPQDKILNLFSIDKNSTTPGTNNETGSGLGLILCKEFIEYHNCDIWVESELDKGTNFHFTLVKSK